jgi:chemotaxis protein CheD
LERESVPQQYLKAGEVIVSRVACEITTVLGPCVAITFFSAKAGLAAICHAMLPEPNGREPPPDGDPLRWKYVCHAIPELARPFKAAGLRPSQVEVKLFGGAHLLLGPACGGSRLAVGSANAALARRLIAEAGFTISAADVGGAAGRKLVFETQSGVVHVKCFASRVATQPASKCLRKYAS